MHHDKENYFYLLLYDSGHKRSFIQAVTLL